VDGGVQAVQIHADVYKKLELSVDILSSSHAQKMA